MCQGLGGSSLCIIFTQNLLVYVLRIWRFCYVFYIHTTLTSICVSRIWRFFPVYYFTQHLLVYVSRIWMFKETNTHHHNYPSPLLPRLTAVINVAHSSLNPTIEVVHLQLKLTTEQYFKRFVEQRRTNCNNNI